MNASIKIHVTRTTGNDVYGHTTDHCDASGCNGHERYFPALDAGEVRVGDVASIDFTAWREVPLYYLASGEALTDAQRIVRLAEYRSTGGMAGVVMAEPTGSESPEESERLCEAGPTVDEIDWSGFCLGTVEASDARVTATGVERAVDVDVEITFEGGGTICGEVTLLPAEDGRGVYESWGDADHWVEEPLLRILRAAYPDHYELRQALQVIAEAASTEAGSVQ